MAGDGYDAFRGAPGEVLTMPQAPAGAGGASVGSPEWWLRRLHDELSRRKPGFCGYSDYYEGLHKLGFASAKFRAAFGGLFREFADNFCDIVVDAKSERLRVEGFRFPQSPQDVPKGEEQAVGGDRDAWFIWQANGLDAASQLHHTETMINGCGYVLVWPGEEWPLITIESPEQTIVAYEPGTRRRAAALKEWWDDWDGYVKATVYLPDGVYKYQSQDRVQSEHDLGQATTIRWLPRELDTEPWPLANPFRGIVPLVPFENRPRLTRPSASEIKGVIPRQDAINKLCMDMLVASEYQSFRQRWATGLEVPTDPQTNQPVEPFKTAVDRLWTTESKDVRFGDFTTVDLGPFIRAIEMQVAHVAIETQTPPHYFNPPGGQFPSGESLRAAEAGLVAKVRGRMRLFGESWEEVIRLAFRAKGDPRASVINAETVWSDPEFRTESEHMDAVIKRGAIGVPQEQLWEDAGYSLEQIARFKSMRQEEVAMGIPVASVAERIGGGAVGVVGVPQTGGVVGGNQ